MTITEWETRWATGAIEDVPAVLVNVEGKPRITIKMERHEAPAGDFIREYVRHLQAPWWRRGPFWKLIEKWMREKLNRMGNIAWHWR